MFVEVYTISDFFLPHCQSPAFDRLTKQITKAICCMVVASARAITSWEWGGPDFNDTSTERAIEYLQQHNCTIVKRGAVYHIHGNAVSSRRTYHDLIVRNDVVYGKIGACIHQVLEGNRCCRVEAAPPIVTEKYVCIQNPGGSMMLGVATR